MVDERTVFRAGLDRKLAAGGYPYAASSCYKLHRIIPLSLSDGSYNAHRAEEAPTRTFGTITGMLLLVA